MTKCFPNHIPELLTDSAFLEGNWDESRASWTIYKPSLYMCGYELGLQQSLQNLDQRVHLVRRAQRSAAKRNDPLYPIDMPQ